MTNASRFPFALLSATTGIADARTAVIARRDYECCTVEYIDRGRGTLEINGHRATLGPDSVYFLHKHSHHRYWPDKADPWHKIFFVVDGELMEYLLGVYRLEQVFFVPAARPLRRYFDEMCRLWQGRGALHRQAAIVFHRFIEECQSLCEGCVSPRVVPVLAELQAFLDESVERRVSLTDYCRLKKVSCASLIRRFKKEFGVSPYDYLMRKRVEEARVMLRHSALPVKEIAARLRFSDPYYFSNYFKRKTGSSPLAYRRGRSVPA